MVIGDDVVFTTATLQEFNKVVHSISDFWFTVVRLPPHAK